VHDVVAPDGMTVAVVLVTRRSRDRLPLQLQHHDDAVLEDDGVRSPRLALQLVFEDGRPGARRV